MAGEEKQERNSLKTRKNLFDKSTMLCFIASVNKYKLTLCSLNSYATDTLSFTKWRDHKTSLIHVNWAVYSKFSEET